MGSRSESVQYTSTSGLFALNEGQIAERGARMTGATTEHVGNM
jgi:hypothetical protein